jgi:alkanesulfonate monooxygenase SsuD/methylene tetrahydromethanopterin reductase-like flavin-dependent oxidoreductase (luciferase family)
MSELRIGTLADDRMLTGPLRTRRRLLERAHASGLDHVFVPDHISFLSGLGMDGLIQAATIAALESDLGIHVGVYLLALRHPLPVARQIATLSESAPGRLVLGVGVGGEDRHEIEICGVDPRTRGKRTNETLIALRGLLTGESTSHRCEFFEFEDALIRPPPEPRVQMVVGGRSDAAIRRAALYADGWLGVWCSPDRFSNVVEEISAIDTAHSAAPRANRDWQHGLQVWVGLDEDRTVARERLATRMESTYQTPFTRFERYSPYGSASEIAERLGPYVQSGCRYFNIMPIAASTEAAIEGVAEIAERLRDSA